MRVPSSTGHQDPDDHDTPEHMDRPLRTFPWFERAGRRDRRGTGDRLRRRQPGANPGGPRVHHLYPGFRPVRGVDPAFEAVHPEYDVVVIAAGSGEALELGRRKDADVLLVHAPAAESAFVAQGHGSRRLEVMYNDFVIVGPASDPAGVRGLDAPTAMRRIARTASLFVSRGDDSGTHRKERELWELSGIQPAAPWYLEAGLGMGDVLRNANEKEAYTLTDRATLLFFGRNARLTVLVEGDDRLFNQYSVIPVAGARNSDGGTAFAGWVISGGAQALIGDDGADRFGRSLFVPNASSGRWSERSTR